MLRPNIRFTNVGWFLYDTNQIQLTHNKALVCFTSEKYILINQPEWIALTYY